MKDLTDTDRAFQYHDGTKHHFNRFAPSLGYLDWASQPRPFRSFDGAPVCHLYPGPNVPGPSTELPRTTYDQLFGGLPIPPAPITAATIGYFLRYSLGLSAWKVFKGSRWSLRVNPSSGNLHPTEAYIATGPFGVPSAAAAPGTPPTDFGETPGVWHYAPDRHVLERRSVFDRQAWDRAGIGVATDGFIVALTSIHWRESWKYGERAFRYCQHDLGHAIAALAVSAAMCGWRLTMLPGWSQRAVGTLIGIDRDEDYVEAEREEPACALLVTRGVVPDLPPIGLVPDLWFGRASQLSEDHVTWAFIDDVARATEDSGRTVTADCAWSAGAAVDGDRGHDARALVVQRRSAVALDGASCADRGQFLRMLSRVMPGSGAPWDAAWWTPRIHLALFVHRVEGVAPGLYVLARAASAVPRLKAAFSREFTWTQVADGVPLWLLHAGDYRSRSQRVSCDQNIAADGFFSLGMIADFEGSLDEHGPSFYRHLFWESGIVGQMLYLEAEAAGARATGIGCFYDDAVHDLLGLRGHAFQSLYHFTVGMPVEDARLTTEPGYPWEG